MDYQITCVCGERFLVPAEKMGGTVTCPACRQNLRPVIESPPVGAAKTPATLGPAQPADSSMTNGNNGGENGGAGEPRRLIPADAEPTKRCPFCGEVILAIARKCKHCGEFLDR